MRIGELSEQTGISQRMLRYYEQEGLLEPKRSSSGYREYDSRSVSLACHIRNLNEAGIKLKNIKVLLPCLCSEETLPKFVGCSEVRATLHDELTKITTKLEELTHSRNVIASFLDELVPEAR